MAGKKRKKKKKFPWILLVLLLILITAAVGTGIFLSRNVVLEGEIVSAETQELDLRGSGSVDVDSVLRLQELKKLDLRGIDVDDETIGRLRAGLPECEILWDIPLGGLRYAPSVTDLTLPELPGDSENLLRLKFLRSLRVERCSDPAAMEALAEALSGCRVSWALGIGGEWFESDCEELDIPGDSVFYEELRGALKWFPSLKSVRLTGAALTREQQRELLELYPDIAFVWSVDIGGLRVDCGAEELAFTAGDAVDIASLEEAVSLGLLPELRAVDFTDSSVTAGERLSFRESHPDMEIGWRVRIMDQSYGCDTQLLDFSGIEFTPEGLEELDEAMAYLPALEQVEMNNTGLTNEALDVLNRKYENVKVVWTVRFGYNNFYALRTDAEYFRASEFGVNPPDVTDADLPIMAYCAEMRALDLGHMKVTDLTPLKKMTHLTWLIIAECPIENISPLSSLGELKYLEMFSTNVSDLTPLVKCKSLQALNCCYIKARQDGAWKALSKMTHLRMLWYCSCPLSAQQIRELKEKNPDLVTFTLQGGESSGGSWRYNDLYREMRDAFHAMYMPGGTNGVDPENPSTQIIVDDAGQWFYLENFDMNPYWWTEERYSMYHPYIIGVTG